MKPRSPLQIKKSVIFALVLREARARIGASRLGAVWMLLEPICHLLVLSVLFALLRGRTVSGLEYPVFVLVGLAPFLLFRNTALRLMDSPKANRSLFAYKQIKPLDTFLAPVLVVTGKVSRSGIAFARAVDGLLTILQLPTGPAI